MPKIDKSNLLLFLVFLQIVAADQLTKFLIVQNLNVGDVVKIFPFFNFVRVHNYGVSFGMLRGIFAPVFFIILSLIVVCFLINYAKNNKKYRAMIVLIISGAVGNIIDRILYKSVVDFFDFHFDKYHWPAFNVADISIVLGVFWLIAISYFEEKKHE